MTVGCNCYSYNEVVFNSNFLVVRVTANFFSADAEKLLAPSQAMSRAGSVLAKEK